ncbi:hypothetical protein [Pseudorhodoferax sp. Leaf274]|uniref:hypothetical protein n=1 Tax=Pseudorhodoferax sp. Leaf274 TaxID=1736318 RepID=UPI000702918B|nr:hypothetical protein [Pseudorhodoferax sp. Leaf274]KQP36119.1 hypothetical protein ASF44_16245 [Pseudorhodoferax sp. Leaf274]
MSLPTEIIDRLFHRLSGAYMSAWDRAIGNTPINDVKSAWAHELSEFGRSRESMTRIGWALDNLPDRPPSAPEFKRLCRQAPMVEELALPMPKADPKKVYAELSKLAPIKAAMSAVTSSGNKEWAHRILASHDQGDKILPYTLKCAREAVGQQFSEVSA